MTDRGLDFQGDRVREGFTEAKTGKSKKYKAKAKAKAKAAEPVAPKAGDNKDRGALFDGRDTNKDGKLNKEEFLIRQSDTEQAAKNFVEFDKDKSGDVNREEYVTSGK
jgi:hypothetical protein